MNKNPLIVANWKMNPADPAEAASLVRDVIRGVNSVKSADVVLCPPYVHLAKVSIPKHSRVALGAQDCFWEQEGAYTGEISPRMLVSHGCAYVILGHSERRRNLYEIPRMINKKMLAALQAGLRPIVCIGERDRGAEYSRQQVRKQMYQILIGIKKSDTKHLIIVYEPEWAISTNPGSAPATPELARESVAYMRETLVQLLGRTPGSQVPILYGGSVDEKNVAGFLRDGGVQGALVGSASLKVEKFVALVKNAVS